MQRNDYRDQCLDIPAIIPKLQRTPSQTRWSGPELGEHNAEVLGDILGLDEGALADLRNKGVM